MSYFSLRSINLFQINVDFLCPLKTPENEGYFRGYGLTFKRQPHKMVKRTKTIRW